MERLLSRSINFFRLVNDKLCRHMVLMGVAVCLWAPVGQATVYSLFTMNKDYHSYNVLHYDVELNNDCSFKNKSPLKVFWTDSRNQDRPFGLTRREKKFFSPYYFQQEKNKVVFTFRALRKLRKFRMDKITLRSGVVPAEDGEDLSVLWTLRPKGCFAVASIKTRSYGTITVLSIFAKVKRMLGIPTGAKYLIITGRRSNGDIIKLRITK